LAANTSQAVVLIGESPAPPGFSGGSGATVGISFTVGAQDLSVTSLGYFDRDQNGLGITHQVSIWNSGGTQIANTTVLSGTGSTLVGSFRYENLGSPVTLTAGQTYTLGAFIGAQDSVGYHLLGTTHPTVDSAVTVIDDDLRANTGSFTRPTTLANTPFWGASMQFTPVPEPAEWAAMAGIGLLGFGLWRRSRRQTAAA